MNVHLKSHTEAILRNFEEILEKSKRKTTSLCEEENAKTKDGNASENV